MRDEMEWRCEWCGKPHDEDDPPCDSCGHHKFEKAVVQVQSGDLDRERSPVWTCTECGREHQKHSPPCSRCGNAMLEKRQPDYSDIEEIEDNGWWTILERKYVAGYAVAAVVLLVVGFGAMGVVDLPGDSSVSIPDAPGEGETAAGLSLDATEREYVAAMNEARSEAGLDSLTRGETLGRMAAYYNKQRVVAHFENGSGPSEDRLEEFDADCGGSITRYIEPRLYPVGLLDGDGLSAYPNESALASALVPTGQSLSESVTTDDPIWREESVSRVGVDVHVAPEDVVYVTTVAC